MAALLAFLIWQAPSATAEPINAGDLELTGLWTRATPPGAPTAAGYLTITNTGDAADRLIAVTTPAARGGEIHEMRVENDVATMRPLPDGLEIPAGATVTLAPGGAHLMFMGLEEPLVSGATLAVTLTFATAGDKQVDLAIAPIGAPGPPPAVAADQREPTR